MWRRDAGRAESFASILTLRYRSLRAGNGAVRLHHPVHADVAQLVAHHLAKVRVASSNLVVRSERSLPFPRGEVDPLRGGVAERRGNGLQIRVHGFKSRLHLGRLAQW